MLKVQEIREIIKLIDQSSIDEFTYEQDGAKLKLKKTAKDTKTQTAANNHTVETVNAAAVQEAVIREEENKAEPNPREEQPKQEAVAESTNNLIEITSPMVGTYYHASSPDVDPFVKVGSKVSASTTVCIVEAMKLFNEIEAEVDGEIVEILVKDGQLVEYGQPLFLVKA
ncbi:acetyl-CoA carboxylase biotin carboxyl carrier protein [Jeotgalibacillus soli]|uniref:Biotin carboxyl carrier protein of acetyl-CoA carboxylase n=1 Tax=Jeotgalibacillus soli TaxID=889306 RepID=A0A0C2RRI0_9BACL|nr:acetyl-CoA carboxylase biotin carboxyl carrier protein [Jeotgalibacillus soli]KIL44359.1 acetyl-CoA carboxylase [Jeotgalibacillus soli]